MISTETLNNKSLERKQSGESVNPLDTTTYGLVAQKKESQVQEFSVAEAMQILTHASDVLTGIAPEGGGYGAPDPADTESTSFGMIGGNPLGEASKALIEQQDLLLKISADMRAQQASACELQNTQASLQYDDDRDSAEHQRTAGYYSAASEIAAGGMSLAAVGATWAPVAAGRSTTQTTIKECDAKVAKMDETSKIMNTTPKPSEITASNAQSVQKLTPEQQAERTADIQQSVREHHEVTPEVAEKWGISKDKYTVRECADYKYTGRTYVGEGPGKPVQEPALDSKGNLQVDPNNPNDFLMKNKVDYSKFKQEDLDASDKEAIYNMKDKAEVTKAMASRRDALSNQASAARNDFNNHNMLLKGFSEMGTHFTQGTLKIFETEENYAAKQAEALARLEGAMSSEIGSGANTWNSQAQTLADQSASVLSNTMDALRRASNAG